ncbi:hypothetical protein [Methylobacterium sp. E-046]|uniref:hypothetical protein n=1 Tax=Methylobacterium sp. E-046 TaxID=2836576 RepID=UPI001FB9FA5E|nr:hypothetical protein [Methylobacterium sp. E-046]MCJ2098910.1 hypothetical protein [Methylobacterium sp. E-046]
MAAKRKLTDQYDSYEEGVVVVADASEDVNDEAINAIREAVREEIDAGNWTIVEGPGW